MRLYAEAQSQAYSPSNGAEGPEGRPNGILAAMETPYVVRSHAASQTHNEQPCWIFNHPVLNKEGVCNEKMVQNIDNERSCILTFDPDRLYGIGNSSGYGNYDSSLVSILKRDIDLPKEPLSFYIHGLLGSFHSVLYKSIRTKKSSVISMAPSSFSTGMFSWFPLYFPLKEPIHVSSEASISCRMWRKSDKTKVWYEWSVSTHRKGSSSTHINTSNVHNPNGRSCFVRL